MARYYLVRGVAGVLVGHPQQGHTARYVGKRRKPGDERTALAKSLGRPLALAEQFDDADELLAEDRGLLKALGARELVKLAGPVVADSLELARAQLAQPKKADEAPSADASPKPGRSGGGGSK